MLGAIALPALCEHSGGMAATSQPFFGTTYIAGDAARDCWRRSWGCCCWTTLADQQICLVHGIVCAAGRLVCAAGPLPHVSDHARCSRIFAQFVVQSDDMSQCLCCILCRDSVGSCPPRLVALH